MGGERTVKIKFTGESRDLERAAKRAERSVDRFGKGIVGSLADASSQIPGVLGKAVGSLPPMGQLIAGALGAGLVAGLAPVVGAAISSAVLLAVGGGVLAAGIKSALDNPRVAKAFDGLKKKAMSLFDDFGKPFEEPLIRASKTFTRVLADIRPEVLKLGKIIAPVIDQLAPALGEFLKNMMPGITSAVTAAVPLFNTLAEKLPGIGRAIGTFFDEISSNGDDTNQFFSDMIDIVTGLIIVVGKVIGWLTKFYSNIHSGLADAKTNFLLFASFALGQIARLLHGASAALSWIPGIGPKLKKAEAEFARFQQGANRELQRIHDRTVRVNVWSNVGSVVANVASQLARLGGTSGKVSGKRAAGGPVAAGRTYLVGERGPELLTMGGSGGNITPNHELGGGTPVVQVFIGDKELEQIAYQVVQQNNRDLKRRLRAA